MTGMSTIGKIYFRLVIAALLLGTGVGVFGQAASTTAEMVPLPTGDVSLETPTGTLSGTLLVPEGKSPIPVVLIIAGSGITDRDGNSAGLSGRSDCLRLLAEGLMGRGIASLRYDKRSVGRSAAARAKNNTFEVQADDAAAWLAWLERDKRFSAVGVVGHSEGALVGTVAAQHGIARAVVSLAGSARRFDDEMNLQMNVAVAAGQLSPKAAISVRDALAELKAGRTVTKRPPNLPDLLWNGLFQPRAQEYLNSIFRYDPVVEISKLSSKGVKILIVQGTTDIQSGEHDASPQMLATATNTMPVWIEGMNHDLKAAPLDRKANDAASLDPRRPLAPGLIDQLAAFLSAELR